MMWDAATSVDLLGRWTLPAGNSATGDSAAAFNARLSAAFRTAAPLTVRRFLLNRLNRSERRPFARISWVSRPAFRAVLVDADSFDSLVFLGTLRLFRYPAHLD